MISYGPVIAILPLRLIVFRRSEKMLRGLKNGLLSKLLDLPLQAFKADLLAWLCAGVIMVVVYYGYFLPYASASIKVLAGCTALGIFCGMLSYLNIEKRVIGELARRNHPDLNPRQTLTLSRKFIVLIVVMLVMMALTVLMMVLLDVYYLMDQDVSQPEVYWGIFKEIVFALVIFLSLSMIIIKRYAANIKQVIGVQLAAMDKISRGHLNQHVPVLTSDEFAQFARKTNDMMVGLQERDFCHASLEKYVSPEVSRKILTKDIHTSGELIDATVLFCDLRDYTNFAESRDPQQVVAFINDYFAIMEPVIRKHGGVVIQFIGDEIEAVFGAPKPMGSHPDKALMAALEMRTALKTLNDQRRNEGESGVRHGIGIHSGMVLAGSVGSQSRLSYALVGDTVNLASRVQALNKSNGTDILLTRATYERLTVEENNIKRVGRFSIKGKSEAIEVFTVPA